MSLACLPWWFYELHAEHQRALSLCAFESEWAAGLSNVLPDYVQDLMIQNRTPSDEDYASTP